MTSEMTTSKISPDGFGVDYYFCVQRKNCQKKLLFKKIDFIASCYSKLFSSIKPEYLNNLVKAYFHCMKNNAQVDEHPETVFSLPSSSASSSEPGSSSMHSSERQSSLDEDCLMYKDLITDLFNRNFQTIEISFATWNIGGTLDFIKSLPLYHNDVLPPEWKEEDLSDAGVIKNYSLWESRRIERIRAKIEETAADIFCIQEINQDDVSKLNDCFTSRRLGIIGSDRDAAVLFNLDRFSVIKSEIHSRGRQSVQLSLAITNSDQSISVGSAHIAGFNLRNPEEPFGTRLGREYHSGDKELTLFSQELAADKESSSVILLGVDANSNEFVHPERLAIPLQLGFKRNTHNDGKTTAFNPGFGEAQLDHLYWHKGCSTKVHFQPTPLPLHISPPSDHKIVSGKITIVNRV